MVKNNVGVIEKAKNHPLIAAVLGVSLMVGTIWCANSVYVTEQGTVTVMKNKFTGEIDMEAKKGFFVSLSGTRVADIDTTQTRIKVDNLTPKDKSGSSLDDLDVTVIVKTNGSKVPEFYKQTKEVDTYKDEAGKEHTMVGMQVILAKTRNAVNMVTNGENLMNINGSLEKYEKAIAEKLQEELNASYPNVFTVVGANVTQFKLPKELMEKANRLSALNLEQDVIKKQSELIGMRQDLEIKSASLDANALASAAKNSGLNVDQIIAWKRAQAAMVQAQNINNVTKVVDVGSDNKSSPAPKP